MAVRDRSIRRLVPALTCAGLSADQIAGLEDVQEVTYLLERAGAELGYRYKWEVFGPFSVELSSDVSGLGADDVQSLSDDEPNERERVAAEHVANLLRVPGGVKMSRTRWLRLVVSVDFVERRLPGATENGQTPPFIELNFEREQIDSARQIARQALSY